MDTLVFRAIDRRGALSPRCRFMLSIDGGQTFTDAQTAAPGQAYASVNLAEVGRVVVYAVPEDPRYWPAQGIFERTREGAVVGTEAPRAFFWTMGTVQSRGDSVTVIYFHLAQFRDVSQEALGKLRAVPKDRWDPAFEPSFAESWVSRTPATIPVVTEQVVAGHSVAFTQQSYAPSVDVRILERRGDHTLPRRFVTAWPEALPLTLDAGPTPFLVFFTHLLSQNIKQLTYFKQYPDGWDYFYFAIYRYLNYMGDPLDVATDATFTRGLLPQIAASGKRLVLVLPVGDANQTQNEVGDCHDAAALEELLLEIQSFFFKQAGLFRSPQPYIGRVALGSFSSGNIQVGTFLSSQRNQSHRFYQDTLREVYCFDTRHDLATGWAGSALRWASKGKNHAQKMIRTYGTNHDAYAPVHQAFMPGQHVPGRAPYVSTSHSLPVRTVGVLPEESWFRAVKNPPSGITDDFKQAVHQLFCGTLLTDALRRSGF
jgi:hypothetical protein